MVRDIFLRPSWFVIMLIMIALIIFALDFSSEIPPVSRYIPSIATVDSIDLSQFKNAEENENCLKCHGQSKYSINNPESGKTLTKRMYSELIINRDLYYNSNHRTFKCIDCHSEEYDSFPHPNNLRLEAKANCIDCHGGDPQYAQYFFEDIDTAFQASVHSEKHSEDFTCWMCHNAHTYKINARTNDNVKETIIYDNTICLDCHTDYRRFELLTDRQNPNILEKHEWLPNQELHFASVRCIECHTKPSSDSTIVEHQIMPKSEALKNCNECHATSSELMASLYKYQAQEVRSAGGFFRGIFTGDSTVIGASRNYTLNIISLVIFFGALGVIIFHAVLRALKK